MDIKEIIKNLTLEEKAALTSGDGWWHTKAVERLGVDAVSMNDGPHGLRKVISGPGSSSVSEAAPAVCFPAACLTAASFDRDLLYEMGQHLASEAVAQGVDIVLGPGVNIKRSPLCGRNFEYFSEDPLLAGELAASFINGVQSTATGTSLKHFFANSQEHRRMDGSSELDERTMREVYLPAFETAVKKSKPWTVMASYNKINGTFATENKRYLTDLLRDEWGFDGVVISDWGATHNRAGAIAAGCDLTMPGEATDNEIVTAVNEGKLPESDLNRVCENILSLIAKVLSAKRDKHKIKDYDYEKGFSLARKIAGESVILLKNDGDILPLKKSDKVAFIGEFAKNPRYQGGGSSHVNSIKTENALDAANGFAEITYAQGYETENISPNETLIAEAAEAAKQADVAVIFAGLPEAMESEGFDRSDMRMPDSHNKLIEAVCAAQPNTVVVLHNGAPVEMPWAGLPKGIIEAYLGGGAIGGAVADVLFGDVNPSGRLPETVPYKLEDNPSYLFYRGEDGVTYYNEGIFVGYRYYATKKADVRYPFGYGLSYTKFSYSNLTLDREELGETDKPLTVAVDVTNTGNLAGCEVVQLYVAPEKKEIIRPVRELRGFDKVSLAPNETKTVTFTLDKRAFAYWDMNLSRWAAESGSCQIQICRDAHSVILEKKVIL